MVMGPSLSDLRNEIEKINRKVMQEQGHGEVSNATVLTRLKTSKAREVELLTSQLVDIALVKLVNEVSNRKGARAVTNEGFDLFGVYRGISKSVTIVRGRKKDTSKLSFAEADLWLKTHFKKAVNDRHEAFKRLVEDCRPFKETDEDTLETAMKRKLTFDNSRSK